jgi:RNA-directed DNA polymerase
MSKTLSNKMVEVETWQLIPWKKLQRQVFRLQKRIYNAVRKGDLRSAHKLQKLLLKSAAARYLAVRKVTQDNRGKKTAGVDGVKELTDNKRLELAKNLKLDGKSKPVKRILIPKPGTKEKRPLGIPTIEDRAKQALAKSVLEPQWEAKFEANSYGFRPGRNAQDAIAAIYSDIRTFSYYVLDADIEKCFDKINHQELIQKVDTFSSLRRQVKAWLKAGVLSKDGFEKTESGTPQGGVISPLLANIALHGLKEELGKNYPTRYTTIALAEKYGIKQGVNFTPPILYRYADDLVILHKSKKLVEECKEVVNNWLGKIGLNLKESKTRIAHTLGDNEIKGGFDFLGFNIRQYQVKPEHGSKDRSGNPTGFKTLIKPTKEAVKRHSKRIHEVVDSLKNAPQEMVINRLNPIIRGWCNYYSSVVSSRIFSRMDTIVFSILRRWANYRSPVKGGKHNMAKYWSIDTDGTWTFKTDGCNILVRHCNTKINYRIRLKGEKSPYDGDWVYWGTRLTQYSHMSKTFGLLLKRQEAKCVECNHTFTDRDVVEIDHIIPISNRGEDVITNKQLLHAHCHDIKTTRDRTLSDEATSLF